ncbi:hypothetical protein DSM104443_03752 [Usitatibacter rugosus]|uniref:Uncharacterized protein n=1 Tax=Usitatibacter rugosus TaxID=2732067 RepID=A0A6M4GZG4_9PROT|nr:YncE family protein [Usitatibacter rugosus]QJR12660.1 hypothetical protein DSM104443_03752 [Usitatibacter rugosus]
MLHRLFALAATLAVLPALAQSACPSRLFVSGYFTTVQVYDACTGAYLQELDSRTRLRGAQAVRLGPDGFLYVVAEEAGVIEKYDNATLAYVGSFASVTNLGATGITWDASGTAYVSMYNTGEVRKFGPSGAALGPAFPAGASGLGGPDNGTTFGPDGNLYIPGYDSSNVVRFDPRTNQTSVAVPPFTAGITATRGLLATKDGKGMYITAELSGQLLRWDLASGSVVQLRAGLGRPTGMAYAPDGTLLVNSGSTVLKVDPATGATVSTFVTPAPAQVNGLVFLNVINKPGAAPTVDASQVGTQYWIVGDSAFNGRVVEFNNAISAGGTGFGADMRPSELTNKRWGSIRFELLSCDRATFTYTSTGPDSANFGTGGYPLQRLFSNEATARCQQQGIDAADKSWVNGQWFGGDSHSGEGFALHRRSDGTTFLAWFTYRPTPGSGFDASQVGSQYWLAGDARIVGRTLTLPLLSATGTKFGPGMTFSELTLKRWGTVTFEFTSCTTANFSWTSTGADSAGFGDGGYPITRFFDDESVARCQAQGIDAADKSWVNGFWWGGAGRSGEGLYFDRRGSDGDTFVAWFTHRPR